jgi:hypothetical protein
MMGKVIRVDEELFNRVACFGVAGDTMATALSNAMDMAERQKRAERQHV